MREKWPIYLVHPQQLHQLPGLSFCLTRQCPIIEARCWWRRVGSDGTCAGLEFSDALLVNFIWIPLNFGMVSFVWDGSTLAFWQYSPEPWLSKKYTSQASTAAAFNSRLSLTLYLLSEVSHSMTQYFSKKMSSVDQLVVWVNWIWYKAHLDIIEHT